MKMVRIIVRHCSLSTLVTCLLGAHNPKGGKSPLINQLLEPFHPRILSFPVQYQKFAQIELEFGNIFRILQTINGITMRKIAKIAQLIPSQT